MPKIRPMREGLYFCTTCETYKDKEEFYPSKQKKNVHGVMYTCKECVKKKTHEYRNTETGFWVSIWNNLVGSAKKRNLEVGITKEDLQALWQEQKGICAVTKLPMEKIKTMRSERTTQAHQYRASVDRIDSSLGYVKGNLRMVCACVNIMKLDQTDEQLKFWCNAILQGLKE